MLLATDPSEAVSEFTIKAAQKAAALAARRTAAAGEGKLIVPQTPGLLIDPSLVTVTNPLHVANPGIYTKTPRQIAAEAAALVPPEDPALRELFNVSRQDIFDMAQDRVRRYGAANMNSLVRAPATPQGSYAAEAVMNPENTKRILNTLEAAMGGPVERPMRAWYVQDPLFWRLQQIADRPVERFNAFNFMHSMASPGAEVPLEITRGTAAHALAAQGRFPVFAAGGNPPSEFLRGSGGIYPPELMNVPGHLYHKTAHVQPMEALLERMQRYGVADPQLLLGSDKPKVPAYIGASGVPQTGFNWLDPVGDVHFSGGIGLHDVRKSQDFRTALSMPEFAALRPWFQREITTPLGMTPVEGQGFGWGVFAPQTGVATAIGVPKLELQAINIKRRAAETGLPAELIRDAGLAPDIYEPQLGKTLAHWGIVGPAGLPLISQLLGDGETNR
jgi:hypothetical protein